MQNGHIKPSGSCSSTRECAAGAGHLPSLMAAPTCLLATALLLKTSRHLGHWFVTVARYSTHRRSCANLKCPSISCLPGNQVSHPAMPQTKPPPCCLTSCSSDPSSLPLSFPPPGGGTLAVDLALLMLVTSIATKRSASSLSLNSCKTLPSKSCRRLQASSTSLMLSTSSNTLAAQGFAWIVILPQSSTHIISPPLASIVPKIAPNTCSCSLGLTAMAWYHFSLLTLASTAHGASAHFESTC